MALSAQFNPLNFLLPLHLFTGRLSELVLLCMSKEQVFQSDLPSRLSNAHMKNKLHGLSLIREAH